MSDDKKPQTQMSDEVKKRALDAVLAEYNDLRDEIKRRIDQRTRMTELMITIDGALAGVAIYTGNLFILGVVPFVSAFCLLQIKASYIIHKRLTRYIREIIEGQKLPYIFEASDRLWVSWETFYREKLSFPQRQKGMRQSIYNMFAIFVFIVCGAAVIPYSFLKLNSKIAAVISFFYALLALITVQVSKMPDPYQEDDIQYDWQAIKPLRPK